MAVEETHDVALLVMGFRIVTESYFLQSVYQIYVYRASVKILYAAVSFGVVFVFPVSDIKLL